MKIGPQKKKVLFAGVGLFALVAVVAVVAFWPEEKEPEDDGKKLSEWVLLVKTGEQNSEVAIRVIGTNAVPFLVKWVEYQMPLWRRWVLNASPKLPSGMRGVFNRALPTKELELSSRAVFAFEILGRRGEGAVPELSRFVKENRGYSQYNAASALAYAGNGEAIAPLLEALTDKKRPDMRRVDVAVAMMRIRYRGPKWDKAVPVLIECLQETNQFVSSLVAVTLGNIRARPEICVPALAGAAGSSDYRMRRNAIRSLGEFAEQAKSALNVVSNGLTDSDANVRKEATNALRRITGKERGDF